MTREEYLNELKSSIMSLSSDEQAEAIQYYSDYFDEADDDEKVILGVKDPDDDVVIYEPDGCPLCNDTGYSGRIGVYEMMPVSKALQAVIARGATADVIEQQALEDDALRKLCSSGFSHRLDFEFNKNKAVASRTM